LSSSGFQGKNPLVHFIFRESHRTCFLPLKKTLRKVQKVVYTPQQQSTSAILQFTRMPACPEKSLAK